MMKNNSVTFVKENINLVLEKFPHLKIRYEFRKSMSLHLIEILPLNDFEYNQEYILEEIKIEKQFEKLYGKNEEILFISSESLIQMKNEEWLEK